MTIPPPYRGVFSLLLMMDGRMGPALLDAYREYAERMYEQSDDLKLFDVYTVPMDVDIESPTLSEWGDFE